MAQYVTVRALNRSSQIRVVESKQVSVGNTTAGFAGTNEVQTLTLSATGGTFTLTYSGQTTSALAYNASAATVETALEALSNLIPAEVAVSGSAGGPYTITFATMNAALLTASAASLTGGSGTAVIAQGTQGASPANEADSVSLNGATGGTFTLAYSGQTTAAIAYNATAAEVQAALVALSNIGSGDVTVTGSEGTFVVTFTGSLAATDVSAITAISLLTANTKLTTTVDTLINLDVASNRRELARHSAIGQYIVTASNSYDGAVALPANS